MTRAATGRDSGRAEALTDRQWMDRAACKGMDNNLWWPVDGQGRDASSDPAATEPGRRVCAACPVVDDCLTYAVSTRQKSGIWGGLTADERHATTAGARTCVDCGRILPTDDFYMRSSRPSRRLDCKDCFRRKQADLKKRRRMERVGTA